MIIAPTTIVIAINKMVAMRGEIPFLFILRKKHLHTFKLFLFNHIVFGKFLNWERCRALYG